MVSSKDDVLLNSLLAALVERWGQAAVSKSLAKITERRDAAPEVGTSAGVSKSSSRAGSSKKSIRPSSSYIVRLDLSGKRRDLLLDMASLFDRREIFPSAADVRNFVQMRSGRQVEIKQRSDAFRRLVDIALQMPEEQLERLVHGGRHGGPSRLGPLSDAIKTAGASARAEGRYGLRTGPDAKPVEMASGKPDDAQLIGDNRTPESQPALPVSRGDSGSGSKSE